MSLSTPQEGTFKTFGTNFISPKNKWQNSPLPSLVCLILFIHSPQDIFTDASLAAHEYEVKRLESIVLIRQNALCLVKRHMDLMAEKQHLEEASKDPSRLTQRGAQAAGRLLQEEKMRKRLNKELPRVRILSVNSLQTSLSTNSSTFCKRGRMKMVKIFLCMEKDI